MTNPHGDALYPRFCCRVPAEDLQQLHEMARRTGLSRSSLVRLGLRAVLAGPGGIVLAESPTQYAERLFAAQARAVDDAVAATLSDMYQADDDQEESGG